MIDDCYQCQHHREFVGYAHILCVNPDPEMTGNPYAIKKGWFFYPFNFDPCWKTKTCVHFSEKTA